MFKTGNLENLIIDSSSTILEAMDLIDKNGFGICFAVKSRKLQGISRISR